MPNPQIPTAVAPAMAGHIGTPPAKVDPPLTAKPPEFFPTALPFLPAASIAVGHHENQASKVSSVFPAAAVAQTTQRDDYLTIWGINEKDYLVMATHNYAVWLDGNNNVD